MSEVDHTNGNQSGMHCLECGAEVPLDASSCPACGNEKNILPSRWSPPEAVSTGKSLITLTSSETRILIALSLALFCALWLLGSARVRSQAALMGESDPQVQMVQADLIGTGQPDDLEITGESIELPGQDEIPIDIDNARLRAESAQDSGNWFDAVDAWTLVTAHGDAAFSDFISLADAQIQVNDTMSARATLNRAVVRFPDQPDGYLKFGALEESLGNPGGARFQYQVGLSYCPGNIDLIEKLHAVETELGYINESFLEPEIEPVPPPTPGVTTTDDGVIVELQVPVIEPEPALPPLEEPAEPPEPENVVESEPESPPPLTIIGIPDPDVPIISDPGVDEVEPENQTGSDLLGQVSIIEVLDLQVSATNELVTISVLVNSPAAFSTSTATEPSRLIVRIPDAQISEGSGIIRDVNINVPIVERVHLGEGESDSGPFVILVIYLGENVRHSVSAESQSVRVRIGKDPGTDAG